MRRFSVVALVLGALALIVPLRAEMVRGETLAPAQDEGLTLMDDPDPDAAPLVVAPGGTIFIDVLANDTATGDAPIDPSTLEVVADSLADGATARVVPAAEAGLGEETTDPTVPEDTVPTVPEDTVPTARNVESGTLVRPPSASPQHSMRPSASIAQL
jgi:hypothetical protein